MSGHDVGLAAGAPGRDVGLAAGAPGHVVGLAAGARGRGSGLATWRQGLCPPEKMSSRSRSSKKHSSSHSSSGDLPANEVISPKIEVEARNELAIIQRTTSNPKDWFERFFFMRSPSRKAAFIYSLGSGVTVVRRNSKSRKDKGVAFESVLGDHPLPGWDPSFTPGERGGTSAAPPPSDFFDDLPPAFKSDELLDNEARRKVTADGSRLVNEFRPLNSDHIIGMRVWGTVIEGNFRTDCFNG
ncbi:hypothetical protein HID58_002390 [Brassica napus]|uniref:Uncharacterized protein n=1 Tax=Brassica napus TaxID=3708 RepID=A0ABQ8EMN7_BRANA|nr:hypothetical protein HID58_002390 [Brassica napus]